ncbi:MAG: quinolinate synthase NadA [Acidobacteriota bacterium]
MDVDKTIKRIDYLKNKKNALILAHNYQRGEVQDVADFVGDSLELSQRAAAVDEDIIVFCGVHFMAETAKMLSPEKTVLLPEINAGCPMADMITSEELIEWKKRYPEKPVVCYINTSADVKAESDVCCTSSNALRVVESVPDKTVLFIPDKNLAGYISRNTKKKLIPWDGYCYVHNNIQAMDIKKKKELYPRAEIWVHPECRPEVIDLADKVFSTGKMVKEAASTGKKFVIIGTETGIIHRLKKINPEVEFIPANESAFCANMKKITLLSVLKALEEERYPIEVLPEVREKALTAIEKMIQL